VQEADRSNPYKGDEDARRAGQKLFQRECASCHGRDAQGGERAPALASPALRQAPPGAIFWVLRNGALWHGMPSFSHLPEQQRWQIVTYLKTL
jgi:mono/diheme cytochrome c family protein